MTTLYQYVSNAQIDIAPVSLYLSDRNQFGDIIVRNTSNEIREIRIENHYGYPITGTEGKAIIKYVSNVSEKDPSSLEWMNVYPSDVVLTPGESQKIRFFARKQKELADGEYWLRPKIISRPVRKNKIDAEDPSKIRSSVNTVYTIAVSVNYRIGIVNTGISIEDLTHNVLSNKLLLKLDLRRTGNAAFLGNIKIILRNKEGKIVREVQRETAVYYTLQPSIELDIQGLNRGDYIAEVELNTNRVGTNEGDILQTKKVIKTLYIPI